MPRPRNDKRAAEQYALYQQGFSLEQVAKAFGCSRQTIYGAFALRGWQMRPRKDPLPFIEFNGERYVLKPNGYYRKTRAPRTYLHRDIWEQERGPIAAGWDIHHKDEDGTNNRIGNLECLPKPEHTRKYSPHNNQHTRGRKREPQDS